MSLGVHRLWKNSMIEWMSPRRGQTLLDVAGGTGDIAFKFLEKTSYQSEAVVLDLLPNWNEKQLSDALQKPLTKASWSNYLRKVFKLNNAKLHIFIKSLNCLI